MPPRHGGEMPMSGEVTPRKVDPKILADAEKRLAALDGKVWANARYQDNGVMVRLSVAIPYDDATGRAAIHSAEVDVAEGSAFADAFQALIDEHMPRLLREGRKAAAACLLSAERAGEMEVE